MRRATSIDGGLHCWGSHFVRNPIVSDVPAGKFELVSLGGYYACAVDGEKKVKRWGGSYHVYPNPEDCFGASQGRFAGCAICKNGKADCWLSDNAFSLGYKVKANAPYHNDFIQISVCEIACGVRRSGSIECWGDDYEGLLSAPLPSNANYTRVSVGRHVICGILTDRRAACSFVTEDAEPITEIIAGEYQDVSAGNLGACLLTVDGKIVGWKIDCEIKKDALGLGRISWILSLARAFFGDLG